MLLAHICSALCRARLKIRTGKNILRQGSTLGWPLNWGTAYKSSSESVESVTKASKDAEIVTMVSESVESVTNVSESVESVSK